jgi:hypothetical protein
MNREALFEAGKAINAYTGIDFLEACCVRKGWEARHVI